MDLLKNFSALIDLENVLQAEVDTVKIRNSFLPLEQVRLKKLEK